MKRTLLFSLMIVIIGFTSCKDEETKPVEVKEPTTAKAGDVVYTINVISGGNAANVRSAGIDQAKVTVAQQGEVTTKTTGTSGQASFPMMSTGLVTVTVEAVDHATVHFTADLSDAVLDIDSIGSLKTRYGSTMVVLYALTGGSTSVVTGSVTCEKDTTPATLDFVGAGKKITAVITKGAAPTHAGVGKITSWSIESAVFSTITTDIASDNTNYKFNVPGTADGLAITLHFDDFIAQKFEKKGTATINPHPQVYKAASIPITSVSGTTQVVDVDYTP